MGVLVIELLFKAGDDLLEIDGLEPVHLLSLRPVHENDARRRRRLRSGGDGSPHR